MEGDVPQRQDTIQGVRQARTKMYSFQVKHGFQMVKNTRLAGAVNLLYANFNHNSRQNFSNDETPGPGSNSKYKALKPPLQG